MHIHLRQGYPPPPPQHYPPPPGPYAPPTPGTNWWAVISLIFGVIGGVLISVVCGIIGLNRAKQGQGGRGMAIAGLVLSALWAVGIVVLVAALLIFGKDTVSATEVKAGDCLKELPDSGLVISVNTAACSEPHTGEIFSVMKMPDGDFPGTFAIEEYQNKCAPELADYSPEAARGPRCRSVRAVPERGFVGSGRPRGDLHRDHRFAPHGNPQEVS